MQRKGFQGWILDTFGVTSDPEGDYAWSQASLVSKSSQDTPELSSEDASPLSINRTWIQGQLGSNPKDLGYVSEPTRNSFGSFRWRKRATWAHSLPTALCTQTVPLGVVVAPVLHQAAVPCT